jgi:hypothetical protein
MKVQILVNLKMATSKILPSGTIFDDKDGPIPESIMKRVRKGTAKIIDATVFVPKAPEETMIAGPAAPGSIVATSSKVTVVPEQKIKKLSAKRK